MMATVRVLERGHDPDPDPDAEIVTVVVRMTKKGWGVYPDAEFEPASVMVVVVVVMVERKDSPAGVAEVELGMVRVERREGGFSRG